MMTTLPSAETAACVLHRNLLNSLYFSVHPDSYLFSQTQLRQVYMASLVVLGGRSFVGAVMNASRLFRAYSASRKKI